MDPAPKPLHELRLSNLAAHLLKLSLSPAAALADDPALKRVACGLVDGLLDDLPEQPAGTGREIHAWQRAEWKTISLTEKQREASKAAIAWAIKAGALPSCRALGELMEQLGLGE